MAPGKRRWETAKLSRSRIHRSEHHVETENLFVLQFIVCGMLGVDGKSQSLVLLMESASSRWGFHLKAQNQASLPAVHDSEWLFVECRLSHVQHSSTLVPPPNKTHIHYFSTHTTLEIPLRIASAQTKTQEARVSEIKLSNIIILVVLRPWESGGVNKSFLVFVSKVFSTALNEIFSN